jgi:hypothetical protein
MALPRRFRLRICTAGEDLAVFDKPVHGFIAGLMNAFPFSKEGNIGGVSPIEGGSLISGGLS